ncbi:MAG: methionyl-tRNA formyltransferase [Clostridia bacterium]|nr:methionyl-tRNA formyltransferase [Clostridia bacterium]
MTPNRKPKIVFMGTPEIAVTCLDRLVQGGFDVAAVVTRIDKPKGRRAILTPPPVKVYAEEHGIEVFQPRTLRDEIFADWLTAVDPDLILVVAFGMILPENVLAYPKYGCINVHASLLPKYRGAAPMQRAIMEGESETGVTVMYMDAGLDTGDMIFRRSTPITETDTLETIHDKLAEIGAELLADTVRKIENGESLPREKQNGDLSTYAAKIEREDAKIDFTRPAAELDRLIRALTPIPYAYFTRSDGATVKVLSARPAKGEGTPGTVLAASFDKEGYIRVACGEGALDIVSLKPEGKGAMTAADYLRGRKLSVGEAL